MTQQMQAKIPPDAETSISPQTQISDYQKQLFQTRVTTYLGKAENQRELVRGFEGAEISLKVWDMVAKGDIAPLVFTRFERDMKDMLGYIASGALELEFKQGAKQMTKDSRRAVYSSDGRSKPHITIDISRENYGPQFEPDRGGNVPSQSALRSLSIAIITAYRSSALCRLARPNDVTAG